MKNINLRNNDFRVDNYSYLENHLVKKDLADADLSNCIFRGIDLDNYALCFSFSILKEADFCGADLTSVDFCQVSAQDADFRAARFYENSFFDARLSKANFCGASIDKIDFRDADLKNANFCGALIENTNFSHTNLLYADFRGATLENNNFCGCTGIETAKFDSDVDIEALKNAFDDESWQEWCNFAIFSNFLGSINV
jgi:uncharacterized protein YjbI with pentapeptide repeats